MKRNYHTHTIYSDGSDWPEVYVRHALDIGMESLGFSDHSPLPFKNSFAIQGDPELKDYCKEVNQLKTEYKGQIDLFLGLEIDFIEGIMEDFSSFRNNYDLDYVIGSVHLVRNGSDEKLWFIDGPKVESYDSGLAEVFNGNVREAVTTYYQHIQKMVVEQKPDIVGHLDKIKMHNKDRYFRENESWYEDLITETLDLIKQEDLIVEVNTRGIYKNRCNTLFPGVDVLKQIQRMNIPILLSSDAHSPNDMDAIFPEAIETLIEIGFREMMVLNENGWEQAAITQ